jgi:biotin-(acetyl-CoA carboxylase) ligase
VTVRQHDGEAAGIFEDIDRDGYLLLNVAGERRRISAGDLFFSDGEGRAYGG